MCEVYRTAPACAPGGRPPRAGLAGWQVRADQRLSLSLVLPSGLCCRACGHWALGLLTGLGGVRNQATRLAV